MTLPDTLNIALQEELSKVPRGVLSAASEELTSRYRSADRDKKPFFITTDAHRLAYLAARMPATFAAVQRVLLEVRQRMPEFSPQSFVDIGSGPGTASWTASEVFPEMHAFTLHEKDEGWLRFGKILMQKGNLALQTARWMQTDLEEKVDFGKQDLTVLSYVVGELAMNTIQRLLAEAWEATSQVIVIVEPGTPHGFERIRYIRQLLIEMGAFLVAPCPHAGRCPMEKGDWCHFSERLQRTALHMSVKDATMGYEDEKYSYVVASRTAVPLPDARILRHPDKHSGHIDFVLCAQKGLVKRTISRRQKELYKLAKKLDWGDILP